MIMFWVSLAIRLLFWASLLGGVWYVYNVGIEQALQDFGWVIGFVEGLLVDQGTPRTGGRNQGWQRQQVPRKAWTAHR